MVTVIESILYAIFLFRLSNHFIALSAILIGPEGYESLIRGSISFIIFVGVYIYLFFKKLNGDELGMSVSVFFSGFAGYLATEYLGQYFSMPISFILYVLTCFGFTYLHYKECTKHDRGVFSWYVRGSSTWEAVLAGFLYGLFVDIGICAMVRTYYKTEMTAYAVMRNNSITGIMVVVLTMAVYLLAREALRQHNLNKSTKNANKTQQGKGDYHKAQAMQRRIDELLERLKFLAKKDILESQDAKKFVQIYDKYSSMVKRSNMEKISIVYLETVYKDLNDLFDKYKSVYLEMYRNIQAEKKKAEEREAEERKEKWKESEYRSSRETEKNNWEKTSYTDGSKESGKKKSKFNKAAGTESGTKDKYGPDADKGTEDKHNKNTKHSKNNKGKKSSFDDRDYYRNANFGNGKDSSENSKYKKDKPKWSTTYFKNCSTETELRRQYYKLVKIYHPDNKKTGDSEIFKNITSEYRFLLERL